MNRNSKLVAGLIVPTLSGAALLVFLGIRPLQAQDTVRRSQSGSVSIRRSFSAQSGRSAGGSAGNFAGNPFAGSPVAANSNFVYVLRGNMLYQMRAGQMNIVGQQALPQSESGANGGASGGSSAGGSASGSASSGGSVSVTIDSNGERTVTENHNSEQHSGGSAGGSASGSASGSAGGSSGGGAFGGMLSPAFIAANNDFVYVTRGSTIYQYRADDLSPVSTQELPEETNGNFPNNRQR